jgi:hypothetical protein
MNVCPICNKEVNNVNYFITYLNGKMIHLKCHPDRKDDVKALLEGKKDDKDKPDLLELFKSLWSSIIEVSRVHNYGGNKYGMDNWKNVEEDRYKKALIRHVAEVIKGNDENIEQIEQDEFYCYHAAQVAWNGLVLTWFAIQRKGK